MGCALKLDFHYENQRDWSFFEDKHRTEYGYVSSDPVNFIDPTGLDREIIRDPNGYTHDVLHIFTPGAKGSDMYLEFGPGVDVEKYQAAIDLPGVVTISKNRPSGNVLAGSYKQTSVADDNETIIRALAAKYKARDGNLKYNFVQGLLNNFTPESNSTNCRGFADGVGK